MVDRNEPVYRVVNDFSLNCHAAKLELLADMEN